MKQPRLTYLFLVLLLALLSASCKKDSLPAPVAEEEESGSGVYVSVVVNTQEESGSRADGATDDYNPTGGENGDGNQAGEGEENMVHDLNVFFFQGEVDENTGERLGINSTDNPSIVCRLYFDQLLQTSASSNGIDAVWQSPVQEVTDILQIGQTYDVLVIANAGDLRTQNLNTLNTLRDYQVANPITNNNTYFLMASENDADVEIQASTKNNPITVSVDVERMTARVDCAWEEEYTVEHKAPNAGGNQGDDKVKILGAALVNRYRNNTYAFKRVTDGTDLDNYTIDYLGLEKTTADGIASNYVLDPKTIDGKNNNDYTYYYTEYVDWDVYNDFRDPTNGNVTSNGDRTYYLLDYTRENINTESRLSEEEGVERYATGIMFKAQYKPAGFTEGETFYRYTASDGGAPKLYTAEALIDAFPETFDDNNQSSWGDIEGCDVFLNGWCYYIYWIRHADDGDVSKISPMEYAIVRNNIYQLYVNSVGQLGTPDPDSNVEEVDTEIHIQVKGWASIDVEVPAFD
ncbi:Mfa1 family fimbria major subunit [Bacteroides gallinaceum]|uniref:Mfa1 family fimbria major subunit n=1 Tax=Bacteroides gallinaceum TaxID=1462571 RepID=UPI00195D14BF|nr:Mfa1 family fimbria major subunit [Bacteroides gallinaceum]MBM6657303.1 Mfa1 fimbrilin C-terminal domain-containing protein [Bacteroides gallinaceum]